MEDDEYESSTELKTEIEGLNYKDSMLKMCGLKSGAMELGEDESFDDYVWRIENHLSEIDNLLRAMIATDDEIHCCDLCFHKSEIDGITLFLNGLPQDLLLKVIANLNENDLSNLKSLKDFTSDINDSLKKNENEENDFDKSVTKAVKLEKLNFDKDAAMLEIAVNEGLPVNEIKSYYDNDDVGNHHDIISDDDRHRASPQLVELNEAGLSNKELHEELEKMPQSVREKRVKKIHSDIAKLNLNKTLRLFGDVLDKITELEYETMRNQTTDYTTRVDLDDDVSYDCKLCLFNVKTKQAICDHILGKHENLFLYKCKLCDFGTNKISLVDYHYDSNHLVDKRLWTKERKELKLKLYPTFNMTTTTNDNKAVKFKSVYQVQQNMDSSKFNSLEKTLKWINQFHMEVKMKRHLDIEFRCYRKSIKKFAKKDPKLNEQPVVVIKKMSDCKYKKITKKGDEKDSQAAIKNEKVTSKRNIIGTKSISGFTPKLSHSELTPKTNSFQSDNNSPRKNVFIQLNSNSVKNSSSDKSRITSSPHKLRVLDLKEDKLSNSIIKESGEKLKFIVVKPKEGELSSERTVLPNSILNIKSKSDLNLEYVQRIGDKQVISNIETISNEAGTLKLNGKKVAAFVKVKSKVPIEGLIDTRAADSTKITFNENYDVIINSEKSNTSSQNVVPNDERNLKYPLKNSNDNKSTSHKPPILKTALKPLESKSKSVVIVDKEYDKEKSDKKNYVSTIKTIPNKDCKVQINGKKVAAFIKVPKKDLQNKIVIPSPLNEENAKIDKKVMQDAEQSKIFPSAIQTIPNSRGNQLLLNGKKVTEFIDKVAKTPLIINPGIKSEDVVPEKAPCPQCPPSKNHKVFSERTLQTHLKNCHPTGEKHICDICGKSFAILHSLKDHRYLVHNRIKKDLSYFCEICGKKLMSKHSLKNHVKIIHEEDFNNFCSICGKGFVGISTLNKHKLSHELKECCKICGKAVSNMAYHVADVHDLSRTQECPFCGKVMKNKSALRVHILGVHEKKGYQCHLCPSSYTQSNDLKKHAHKVHGIIMTKFQRIQLPRTPSI